MRKNRKSKIYCSKLMNLFILLFTLFPAVLLPALSEAAYKIYLKNGQVMTGVSEIKEEGGKIKINKYGIMLELPKANVIKIEEYNTIETTEKETIDKEKSPAEEELPSYLRYEEAPYGREQELNERNELQQLKRQYQLVLNELKRIETLENRSKELQRETHKKWSPRKARIALKEKTEIDKELEGLRMEKDLLLSRKKDLEARIGKLERQ